MKKGDVDGVYVLHMIKMSQQPSAMRPLSSRTFCGVIQSLSPSVGNVLKRWFDLAHIPCLSPFVNCKADVQDLVCRYTQLKNKLFLGSKASLKEIIREHYTSAAPSQEC